MAKPKDSSSKRVAKDQKVVSLDVLAKISGDLKSLGKKVVQCHGVFDLVHPGHIMHFRAARREGDALIVTVTPDRYVNKGPDRPVFHEVIRAEALAAIEAVDFVAINETPTSTEAIKKIRPDVYVKGQDYSDLDKDITGGIHEEIEAVESVGGHVHFTEEITFSSTELLNTHFGVFSKEAEAFLYDFKGRYTADEIISDLESLRDSKVLVIGESILDEYHYCVPLGKSSKETIIVTRYIDEEIFAGGVLASANHMAGFCSEVHLVTTLGEVETGEEFIRQNLKPNIKPKFFYQPEARTPVKRRFVEKAFFNKMFEICFLGDGSSSQPLQKEMGDYLGDVINDYDLVLVQDYGHGMIGDELVELLCGCETFLAVNTQTNSDNIGYNMITKYPRADFFCVDEPELRLSARSRHGNVETILEQISAELKVQHSIVTRGHMGSIAYSPGGEFHNVPVFSQKIVDRVGAGDAYISIAAPCVQAGLPMEKVAFIGNAVGALAVGIVGNRSAIEPVDLYKFITALLK